MASYEKLLVEDVAIEALNPAPYNPRRISDEQLTSLQAGLEKFGFVQPVVVDRRGNVIVGGHQRVRAWAQLGHDTVPCHYVDLPEAEEKALNIALNKISGEWDEGKLAQVLGDLKGLGFEDFTCTGFSSEELNSLGGLGGLDLGKAKKTPEPDEIPEPPKVTISKPGDVYEIGPHRLICGDSTIVDNLEKLLDGVPANMAFTDPPYNVDYGSKPIQQTSGKYKDRHIKNDALSSKDWDNFVRAYLTNLLRYCDGNIYIAMSDKELGHLQQMFVALGGKWASFIIWVKDRFVLSPKDYHSKHETILYGWRDGVKSRKRVEDRSQHDVWEIPRPARSEEHPTMKPVELVLRAIMNSSDPGDVVLDLFGGSGTTMVAAHQSGRKARLIELTPHYCDVIVARMKALFPELEVKRNGKKF